MQQATFTLEPVPPFDFELTADTVVYNRDRYGADRFENGVLRRLLDVNGSLVLISARSAGTKQAPRLEVELEGSMLDDAIIADARSRIAWMLSVDDDVSPFADMAAKDPHLSPLVDELYGLHIARNASAYEGLVMAILGQQISWQVARMLRTLLIETYGRSAEFDGATYYTFPAPESLVNAGLDGLRAIKFSQRKAEYILDIASNVASGSLDLEGLRNASAEDATQMLVSIRGVGEWTAHWLMIRALGHTDGFPHGDLALQRAMGMLVNGGEPMSPKDALDYSERWSPYRSYVTAYIFAALRSGRLD